MLALLSLAIAAAVAFIGFVQSRNFVRGKLRYVDVIHKGGIAFAVGAAAALIAWPVTALIPFVGMGTAAMFGLGVGAGVAVGAKDVRRRLGAG